MTSRTIYLSVLTLTLIWLLPAVALAQFGGLGPLAPSAGQTVAGSGAVTVTQPPGAMRMYLELIVRGSTMQEALDRLKQRREAVKVQLEALNAELDSIKFSSPKTNTSESAQKQRMEAMVIQRLRSRGQEIPPGLQAPKSVGISTTLTVDWPLEAKEPEELLLAVEALKKTVKSADLSGAKDTKNLSPEEQELTEEMTGMMNEYGEEPLPVGEPHFVFVAKIDDPQREKAMADAFAKAKAQAGALARAAGHRLGPLAQLAGHGGAQTYYGDGSMDYRQREYLQRLMGMEDDYGNALPKSEAMGTDPQALTFTFAIEAVFQLQPEE